MTRETDYYGRINEFYKERPHLPLFVLDVKSQIGFERFTETFDLDDFTVVFPYTDYAGFHATDPNWYEEGKYKTGIIRENLFQRFEQLFKEVGLLEDDQILTPVCHYSDTPGEASLFPFLIRGVIPRPNLVIDVTGGEHDSWGQFICCNLGERRYFEMVEDPEYVNVALSGEGAVG